MENIFYTFTTRTSMVSPSGEILKGIGVSTKPFDTFNLGYHVGDEKWTVTKNRAILAKICQRRPIFMDQYHSDKIIVLDAPFDGGDPHCDAIITDQNDLTLCVMVADCAPVLLWDSTKGVIAAIHAGRVGITKRIITKTVTKMANHYGCMTKDMHAIVGPHICRDCYEIGDMDLGDFDQFIVNKHFDMRAALSAELSTLGLANFEIGDVCTCCHPNYYSYRRDQITGRQVGMIGLKSGLS